MDYAGLKAAVNSTFHGRGDIPDHVYELVLAEFNRDLRTVDMIETASITADAEYEALPADFLQAISLHLSIGGVRYRLQPMQQDALNYNRPETGVPRLYAVTSDGLKLHPTPDAEYTLTLEYYEQIAALSGDSDTNVILSRYPEAYLYTSLKHAALWNGDSARLAEFAAASDTAKKAVAISERSRKNAGPWRSRPARSMRSR